MTLLRHIAVFVLLAALPFQAAIGATGLHCLTSSHHVHVVSGVLTVHDHSSNTSGQYAANDAASQDAVGGGTLHLLGDGECSACSSCCFAAAVFPTTLPPSAGTPASLKIRSNVDTAVIARDLDGLFRPPRTIAL